MNKQTLPPQTRLITCLILGLLLSLSAHGASAETKDQRDARMQWWRQARFGMFVHWGLYSGLAGTWKDEAVGTRGGMEWIQQRVRADTWEYAHEAVPHFGPTEDFATAWAKLAKAAGCRYVVFTTKHHDGFCLFDSEHTTYDAKDLVGRDLCREITDAVRAEGLKVGYYHSVIDWHHPQYDYIKADQLPFPLKGKPSPNGARHHDMYVNYLHKQARELFTNYGDVDVVWWDYSKKGNDGPFWRSDDLMAMAKDLQPAIISNNRLYHIPHIEKTDSVDRLKTWKPEQGDFTTPEQTIPSTGIPNVDWEVCMTMNTTWGYSEHDTAWKSNETLITNLVDIVSKGGNYLLNIGPKGDGSIPAESIESMKAIGRWMATNGEAIYDTTASPFEQPTWGRYTKKPGKLYAHVFEWPTNGTLNVPLKGKQGIRAYLLADADKKTLKIQSHPDGVTIRVPEQAPDAIASVVAIEFGASLFNGTDIMGWHVDVPKMDNNPGVRNPFIVREGLLVSLGSPGGHLITDATYQDYRLEVEYRFAAKPGNCGVLVHASTPRALYDMFPKSLEVQMMHKNAGDFWCIVQDITVPNMEQRRGPKAEWGVIKGKKRRVANLTDGSEKPVGEWNRMVIECVGDAVKVWVNGDMVNHGYDCTTSSGQIALQAEGSEVEFRKVFITPIKELSD